MEKVIKFVLSLIIKNKQVSPETKKELPRTVSRTVYKPFDCYENDGKQAGHKASNLKAM